MHDEYPSFDDLRLAASESFVIWVMAWLCDKQEILLSETSLHPSSLTHELVKIMDLYIAVLLWKLITTKSWELPSTNTRRVCWLKCQWDGYYANVFGCYMITVTLPVILMCWIPEHLCCPLCIMGALMSQVNKNLFERQNDYFLVKNNCNIFTSY